VIIAAVAIVVLLPAMVVIGAAIFIVDGWPVMFVHHRVGRFGRDFTILKFRSLPRSMPRYAPKVPDDDPRASRLGRFLRRTGLDELPQLANVLVGHMSLVGPRPEQPFVVSRYRRWQHRRHEVRPGMTGPWQAAGRPGPLEECTALELEYVDRRSLGLDASIAWQTLCFELRRRRADVPRPPDLGRTRDRPSEAAHVPSESATA
jgi:lipopolysaccharide/colanic/teichoic acid biosynthesis glycosyltransferase